MFATDLAGQARQRRAPQARTGDQVNAIFQAFDEQILADAVWTGTTPTDGSVLLFERFDPATIITYEPGTSTVTATISSARGDILAIPATNADGLVVTNGTGLNLSIPIPEMPRSGIPRTIVCDLSALQPNNVLRTSTVWHFTFTCSTGFLIVGAAIALYSPLHELAVGDFQWGGSDLQTAYGISQESPFGVRYLTPLETASRSVKVTKLATAADLQALQDWYDGSWGQFRPALLWPDPSVNDALVGTIQEKLDVTKMAPSSIGTVFSVGIQFDELTKAAVA